MTARTIDILMATCNGEAFLPMQLRSLLNQTHKDWHLLVHDDGSTDGTQEVLRTFAALDDRIEIITDDVRFGSAARNFLHLLQFSSSPFCIFCDQDDIWLENKLEVLHAAITQRDNGLPQAVCCNAYMYEAERGEISGHSTPYVVTTLKGQLFCNGGLQGCSVMFNAKVREICLRTPAEVAMHDHLMTLAALTFGELSEVPVRLMLYRRHTHTVTGYTDKGMKDKVKGFFHRGKTVLDPRHFRATKAFFEENQHLMPAESRETFQQFFRYQKRGRLQNALHAYKDGFSLYGRRTILAAKLLLRPLI